MESNDGGGDGDGEKEGGAWVGERIERMGKRDIWGNFARQGKVEDLVGVDGKNSERRIDWCACNRNKVNFDIQNF